MRAYWLLPIWVLMEINYGTGPRDGIGHWAHVGGFLFGGIAAVALRYSGLEHKVNKAIEERVAWTPGPEISQANELMEQGKLTEAAAILNEFLADKPDSFAAWNLLRAIHWRASNIPAYREATCKLCDLHVRSREYETAWQDYEDFLNAGGERIPPDVWLDLCRVPEQQHDFERAVSEYEKLAAAYPSERQSTAGAAWCRPNLPQATEPPAGCVEIVRGGVRLRRTAPRFGARHPIGNSGSQNRALAG